MKTDDELWDFGVDNFETVPYSSWGSNHVPDGRILRYFKANTMVKLLIEPTIMYWQWDWTPVFYYMSDYSPIKYRYKWYSPIKWAICSHSIDADHWSTAIPVLRPTRVAFLAGTLFRGDGQLLQKFRWCEAEPKDGGEKTVVKRSWKCSITKLKREAMDQYWLVVWNIVYFPICWE